jgi:hypothetical protein
MTQAAASPQRIDFGDDNQAFMVEVEVDIDPALALQQLGIQDVMGVIVVEGGAASTSKQALRKLWLYFLKGLVPFAQRHRIMVVDGGTDAGTYKLLGEARRRWGATFPYVGVTVNKTAAYPGGPSPSEKRWPLDRHHSHFLLVNGEDFGDETQLLVGLASLGKVPGIAVVAGGGQLVQKETRLHAQRGTPIIALKGSERYAEKLATDTLTRIRPDNFPDDSKITVFDIEAEEPKHLYNLLKFQLFTR